MKPIEYAVCDETRPLAAELRVDKSNPRVELIITAEVDEDESE